MVHLQWILSGKGQSSFLKKQKGIGKILLKKLAAAALENGISGLIAYTSPENMGMIRLFRNLPYKIQTTIDYDTLILSCKFDEFE